MGVWSEEAGTNCSKAKNTRAIIKHVFSCRTEIEESAESELINEVSFIVEVSTIQMQA